MKILFRADSSSKIGLGHIMRDVVLAEQFVGDEITFACRDLEGHIMEKIPYPIMILDSDDIDALIMIVKKKKIEMLVIDHYGISWEDEKRIKEMTGVKILAFDGSYRKHHCDFLLNQNIYADATKYKGIVPSFCKLFYGLEYALIREEFKKAKSTKVASKTAKGLITLGGADPDNKTLTILQELEGYHDRLDLCVIVGAANTHQASLKSFINSSKHRYRLIIDAKNMAEMMQGIDFAISAAGSTTIELLYMKIPFFTLSIAANQDMIFDYLMENSLAFSFDTFSEKLPKLLATGFQMNRDIEIATKSVAKEILR